jgi:hypothetical protein
VRLRAASIPSYMTTDTVALERDMAAFSASHREVVFPINGVVRGADQDFGTGVLIGGGEKGYMHALTATHVFTRGVIKAMRPRTAAQTALPEFLPDNWNSPEAAMRAGNIRAELRIGAQIHMCPIVGYDPHEQSDLTLLLIRLPPPLADQGLKALNINSDDLPYGVPLVSAGFRKNEDGPGRQFCIGVGIKLGGLSTDDLTGAPLYHLSAPSEHGMSGGPILRVDEAGHLTLGVSALISRGDEGSLETKAVSLATLYTRTFAPPYYWGAKSFIELISSGQVRDRGEDRHLIEVIRDGDGAILRRHSRIERGDRPLLLVPRRFRY